jgi:hypothetical protein
MPEEMVAYSQRWDVIDQLTERESSINLAGRHTVQ